MAAVSPEQKARLMESGKWAEFCHFRSDLIMAGTKSSKACDEALEKFLGPDEAEKRKIAEREATAARKASEPKPEKQERTKKQAPVGQPAVEDDPLDGEDMVGRMPKSPGPVPLAAFMGKPDVAESENIRWVCDNMRVKSVTPAMCPSLRAWTFLCDCRESALFRSAFYREQYGKLVVKQTDEGEGGGESFDGVVQDGTILRILAIREQSLRGSSVAEHRPHAPGAAGSSPASASSPEGAG
jgi:hypothetical protein